MFTSHIKITRENRSALSLSNLSPKFPSINGLVVGGGAIPSGISYSNPSLRGKKITIDKDNNTFTVEELFNVEIIDVVHKDRGQKLLFPSFDAYSGRCFFRGRSSGSQAAGETTTDNGILEINPETGAYNEEDTFDLPGSSSYTDPYEISKDGIQYVAKNNGDGIALYDLDYNFITSYDLTSSAFRIYDFGVNPNGDVIVGGSSTDAPEYISKDKSNRYIIPFKSFEGAPSQWRSIRLSNTTIYLTDNNDRLHAIDIATKTAIWSRIVNDFSCISLDFNGDILAGRNPSTQGWLEKIDKDTGNTIFNVKVSSSGGTSPAISQTGVLSTQYYYVFAGVIGGLFIVKSDGTVLDNSTSFGRGNLGIHPFNNNHIQNFDIS